MNSNIASYSSTIEIAMATLSEVLAHVQLIVLSANCSNAVFGEIRAENVLTIHLVAGLGHGQEMHGQTRGTALHVFTDHGTVEFGLQIR